MSRSFTRNLGGAVANAAAASVTRLRAAAGRRAEKSEAAEEEAFIAANEDAEPVRPDPSVLSANTEMKGSIATTDELYIQGRMEGDVRATSVIVCQGGVVRGDIAAETVTVYGTVTGNLDGRHVLLCAGAVVDGEISHCTLGIDTGASFEGSIKRKTAETPIAAE
jgi:cytoskeletal protein CcmA (bactofilin family)